MKFSKLHRGLLGMYIGQSLFVCIAILAASFTAVAAPHTQNSAPQILTDNPFIKPVQQVRSAHQNKLKEVPEIKATSLKRDGLIGVPGSPLPLAIEPPQDYESQFSFAMVKGLPKDFQLSAGFQTSSSWLLLLTEVEGLTITPPQDFQGRVQFEIVLFKDKHSPGIIQKAEIDIQTRYAVQTQSAETQPVDAATAALPLEEERPSILLKNDDAEPASTGSDLLPLGTELMMSRASQALRNSDVSSARQFYERLARQGLAEAAFAMGQTFDPSFLDRLNIHGLKPDLETAKLWYQRASELGSAEASKRLSGFSE